MKKKTKAAGPPGGQILQILMAQNLYFIKLYNIPEMINHVVPAKETQSTFVIFGKLPPKTPHFWFFGHNFGTGPGKTKIFAFSECS